jgi:citrate lyase beta subunit
MKTSLRPESIQGVLGRLHAANAAFHQAYAGATSERQPVHTVYGGAHLFKSDSAQKIGKVALGALSEYGGNFAVFAKALALRGSERLPEAPDEIAALHQALHADPAAVRKSNEPAWLAHAIHTRVTEKLKREPVEDFRIDFEDGYGNRPDAEEDGHAALAAEEVAKGMAAGTLPPFIGIRIKPFTQELADRSIRTLDLFVTTLVEKSEGRLPANFVVTLPKVQVPEQVAALAELLATLEEKLGLAAGSLKLNRRGEAAVRSLVDAAEGRCTAAHFGTYDYTASCNITAAYQGMTHPVCDFARHVMQVALAGTPILLSDGATNVMPIGPHRAAKDGPALTAEQILENRAVVHRAWKLHYDQARDSLMRGFYQGWDLHPAQLPTRYAAVFSFFLEGLDAASVRLRNFVEKAAQATLVGDVFDDAATGQGLLNYFLRGMNCGALTEDEALATGLTIAELRSRSFVKIWKGRRKS